MEEIWKDVIGFEGLYQVSNLGRVKSLEFTIHRSNGRKQLFKEKILSPRLRVKGYLAVCLFKLGKRKEMLIHRLVAINFLNKDEKRNEINHKNGIKTDNRLINLEWCTRSENMLHAFNSGLKKCYVGEKNAASVLNKNQVLEIRSLYGTLNEYQLANKFNVSRGCISGIVKKRTWKHI